LWPATGGAWRSSPVQRSLGAAGLENRRTLRVGCRRAAVQPEAGEQPLDGALRRPRPLGGDDDRGHLCRRMFRRLLAVTCRLGHVDRGLIPRAIGSYPGDVRTGWTWIVGVIVAAASAILAVVGVETVAATSTGETVVDQCGSPAVRPEWLTAGCMSMCSYTIVDITWSSWTATEAAGAGTYEVSDGVPSCAEGHVTRISATVHLSVPARGDCGVVSFTRFDYVRRDTAGAFTESLFPYASPQGDCAGVAPASVTPLAPTPASAPQPSPTPAPGAGPFATWFPYPDYFSVPQLGFESVVGTGCGSSGEIGDVIPDGIWRGWVTSLDGTSVTQSTSLEFDLVCVFIGELGDQFDAEWEASADPNDYPSPAMIDGFPVSNSDRSRVVPLAPDFVYFESQWIVRADGTSTCPVAGPPNTSPQAAFRRMIDSWLVISGGQAKLLAVSCPYG